MTGYVTQSKTRVGDLHLHYFTFYAKDSGMQRFARVYDAHDFDIEHLIVEIDAAGIVRGVLYMPHGSKEHFWIRHRDDLKEILEKGKRPKVFVSKDKHAQYPQEGRVLRYGLFANDNCTPKINSGFTVQVASQKALLTKYIDGVFRGLPSRIEMDFVSKPEVRLRSVRYRMLVGPLSCASLPLVSEKA